MTTRTLTLLFTDMVGSTALLSGMPVRDADRLRRDHFGTLHDETERHRGSQIKTLGDGVMVAFESAREAIGAAIAMQQAMTGKARIRAGISSGDVSIENGDCFGTPAIEASRLCAAAVTGQVLVADSTRLLARPDTRLSSFGSVQLKGLSEPTAVWEAVWSPSTSPLRVVLADDAVLVREGIARILEECGVEVVAQAGDPDELIRATEALHPDLAIVDIRMPPTRTDEGLVAAERILATQARTAVLVLSQDWQPHYASRLRATRSSGVGYLLKERVADVREFARTVRHVAKGGQAFEQEPDEGGF